ncbi:MAG: hypothetical protein QF554_05935 [Dehalococcoidia bacterium]|jgi:hypothetical protein|nr:hypothetical protein [Dehalococcoidia bacterium]
MTSTSFNPRSAGLQVFVVSVVISAALAIISLIRGEFGDTDGKILMTALAVAAASVLTLSNGIVLERGRSGLLASLPSLAILVSITGFVLLIVMVWNDFEFEDLGKTAASVVIVGVALTHWSLVSIARIPARFRWLRNAAYPLSGLLAAFLVSALWERVEGPATAQTVGVIGVLTVATSIILPVLQRLSPSGTTKRRGVSYCPYCGKSLRGVSGRITCPSCDSAFRVRPA